MRALRLVSYNINGKSIDFDPSLADIVCIQEVKKSKLSGYKYQIINSSSHNFGVAILTNIKPIKCVLDPLETIYGENRSMCL